MNVLLILLGIVCRLWTWRLSTTPKATVSSISRAERPDPSHTGMGNQALAQVRDQDDQALAGAAHQDDQARHQDHPDHHQVDAAAFPRASHATSAQRIARLIHFQGRRAASVSALAGSGVLHHVQRFAFNGAARFMPRGIPTPASG